MLTLDVLNESLKYDQKTGLFVWKLGKRGLSAGTVAGCVNGDGYIQIKLRGVTYKAHVLAWLYMTGSMPRGQIDHIDHVRTNNAFCNLRDIDEIDNHRNQRRSKANSSGYTGVYFDKTRDMWIAGITVNGTFVNCGRFVNKEDAIHARKQAEVEYGFHVNHGAL